ncbi:hypothetical protein [Luteimonas terricola]|uniref:Uncharacterized protein n=1 Tax=Luteimonas terricola TaxID=645597 RepID=A0ABQ2EFD9_9GAMM|nr:hypothetical protein [Luteimonas terricola]GGK08820.1 hypothetical protein GCM10011394_17830 [Luteimonas terricola]
MSGPLTRTEQVLKVLKAGGFVRAKRDESGILRLLDADGREVPAWQNAIKAAQRIRAAVGA